MCIPDCKGNDLLHRIYIQTFDPANENQIRNDNVTRLVACCGQQLSVLSRSSSNDRQGIYTLPPSSGISALVQHAACCCRPDRRGIAIRDNLKRTQFRSLTPCPAGVVKASSSAHHALRPTTATCCWYRAYKSENNALTSRVTDRADIEYHSGPQPHRTPLSAEPPHPLLPHDGANANRRFWTHTPESFALRPFSDVDAPERYGRPTAYARSCSWTRKGDHAGFCRSRYV